MSVRANSSAPIAMPPSPSPAKTRHKSTSSSGSAASLRVLTPKPGNTVHSATAGGQVPLVSGSVNSASKDGGKTKASHGPGANCNANGTTPIATVAPAAPAAAAAPGSASKPKTYPKTLSRDPSMPTKIPKQTPTKHSSKASRSSTITSESSETEQSTYATPPSSPDSTANMEDSKITPRAASSSKVEGLTPTHSSRTSSNSTRVARNGPRVTSSSTGTTSSSTRTTSNGTRAASNGTQRHVSSASRTTNETPLPSASTNNEAEKLVAMLRGRSELEILRSILMSDKAIQTLKRIVSQCRPAFLHGLSPSELEALERGIALLEFYWFTHKLDVDILSAFVGKVTYGEIRDVAEAEEGSESGDESFVDAEAASQWADAVAVAAGEGAFPAVSGPVPMPREAVAELSGFRSPARREPKQGCSTPPNETRVDPRTAHLDPETRELRRMGRRCASGAALMAAAKRAMRGDEEEEADELHRSATQ